VSPEWANGMYCRVNIYMCFVITIIVKMRQVFRRGADSRRANTMPQIPSLGIPSLLHVPDE
jgi:hypothetical protein